MNIIPIDFIDLATNRAFAIPNANYYSTKDNTSASINFNQAVVPGGVSLEIDNTFEAKSASPDFEDTGIYMLSDINQEGQINLVFYKAF